MQWGQVAGGTEAARQLRLIGTRTALAELPGSHWGRRTDNQQVLTTF